MSWALVVEDDPSWQEILCELLEGAGLQVEVAYSLADLEQCQRPHRVAVVDLSLAGSDHHNQDGMAVLATLQEREPGCRAVLLTGFATVELAVRALKQLGAVTCLRKESFSRVEFQALLREILASPLDTLTEREREVLDLLVEGLTNQAIGERLFISPNTVKRHLKAVFEKLGVRTRAAAVAVAMGRM